MRARSLLPAVVLLTLAAPAGAATQGAPKAATAEARAYARAFYAHPSKVDIEATYRSGMKRSWSLITGSYGKTRIWAAWVRRVDGRQRVRIFRTRDFDPGERVPCDLRPAFSEPIC